MRVTRTVQIHPGVSLGLPIPTTVLDSKTVSDRAGHREAIQQRRCIRKWGVGRLPHRSTSPNTMSRVPVTATDDSVHHSASCQFFKSSFKTFSLFKNIFFRPIALRYSVCVCVHAHACMCVHARACACVCGVYIES